MDQEINIQSIVDIVKAEMPGVRIFQIEIPERDGEVYLARKASWAEYKKMLGAVKNEAEASELLVQKFLVYPKPNYEAIQMEWDPGLVMILAAQIQKGLGFTQGAALKNW